MMTTDDIRPSGNTAPQTRYFIAVCPERHKPFVVGVRPGASEHAPAECPECGGPGEFIPGAYYSEPFLSTVARVIDALHAAHLSPRAAESAAEQLERMVREPSLKELRASLAGLPGLEPLETLLPGGSGGAPHDLRRFVSLLRTVLLVYADHQGRASARAPESSRLSPPAPETSASVASSDQE